MARAFELGGKTLGIIGFGRIGQALGRMAKGIGMRVIAFDVYHIPGIEVQMGIPYVEMEELLAQADFISVHAPAVDGGALINAESIAKMKDGVVIIINNTSRGTNVDEAASEALSSARSGPCAARRGRRACQECGPVQPSPGFLHRPTSASPPPGGTGAHWRRNQHHSELLRLIFLAIPSRGWL
ncbi:MAG: NAD(P)-dependent oxidoreductase [Oscillospiraceae bacterium]